MNKSLSLSDYLIIRSKAWKKYGVDAPHWAFDVCQ